MARISDRKSALPDPRLTVQDLRVALALAAAGSTAAAAGQLHITQSAISRALLALESKLEQTLFERSARGLTPTAAGQLLVQRAPQLLRSFVELEAELCTQTTRVQPLRMVCECYTAYHWLPSTLAGLRAHSPALEITVAIEHTHEPVAALREGHADVALLTTAEVSDPELRQAPLLSDEIVFVVARTHPLAQRAALTRADLLEYPLLTSSQTPSAETQWFLRRVFGHSQVHKRLRVERLPLTEAILDMTRAGMGIAVMSAWIAGSHLHNGELVARRLRKGPLQRSWRIAYRREHEPSVRVLVPILQAACPRAPNAPQLRSVRAQNG